MAEDDPNLIVRLVPLDKKTRTAWKDSHNAPFHAPASFQSSENREGSSRVTSPDRKDAVSEDNKSYLEPDIRLRLDEFPKDVTKGFVFGGDRKICDIYCNGSLEAFNISGQVFSITINKKGHVVLKYLDTESKISVQYGDQKPGVRSLSTWILFPECQMDIIIKVGSHLHFRAIVPRHHIFPMEYSEACYDYVTDVESAVEALPFLTTNDQPVIPNSSQMLGTNTEPFYYRCKEKELGSGFFGKVYLVYDVSTGKEYVGKEIQSSQVDYDEGHILASQNHKNIVQYVRFTSEGGPLIVTEYVRGGNLANPWHTNDQPMWSPLEISCILYQCLHALAHLHAKPNTIHRNIKPENILVGHRYPSPHVKIGDFGFTKEGSMLGGKGGSWMYTAPEVLSDGLYSTKMDIWSLGVVIMEMSLGRPLHKLENGVAYGPRWCSAIENLATKISTGRKEEDQESSQPLKKGLLPELRWFIAKFMLKVDPKKRVSAKECLYEGRWTVFSHYYTTDPEEDSEN